jgi:CubicO group peptidase (beta-lactamase class C family)
VHSIRKSFLSGLYGIAVAKGQIDLNATLGQLGIDDNEPSLMPEEKQARVIDLLKARSGIYHAALYESPAMKAEKPPRGSHSARSFWYHNNWDFNALGTICEKLTHDSIYHSFDAQIAQRIDMEDYDPKEQECVTGPDSIHRAYPFRMSARDMARFGLLYLRGGRWRGAQLIPAQWIRESTTAYSVAGGNARDGYSGYGYLWWVAVNGNHYPKVELPDGSFSAWGAGGPLYCRYSRSECRRCAPRKYRRPREEGHVGTVWRTLAPHPRRQEKIESWCPLRFMIAILRDTNLAQVW